MREDGFVAISEVETPDLAVAIGRACHDERAVCGDVHAEHGQLVAVQREEVVEGVDEDDLDGVVEQRDGEQAVVGADLHALDLLVRLVPRALVHHRKALPVVGANKLTHLNNY